MSQQQHSPFDERFGEFFDEFVRSYGQQQQRPARKLGLKEIAEVCQNASGQGWKAKMEATKSTRGRDVFRVVFRDPGGNMVAAGWHDSRGAALCATVFEILTLAER